MKCVECENRMVCSKVAENGCVSGKPYTTNADKIRSMTDEELVDFLDSDVPDCARLCPDYKAGCSGSCKHHQGKDFLLKWLQSEVE